MTRHHRLHNHQQCDGLSDRTLPFRQPLCPSLCPGANFKPRCDHLTCPRCTPRRFEKLLNYHQTSKAQSPYQFSGQSPVTNSAPIKSRNLDTSPWGQLQNPPMPKAHALEQSTTSPPGGNPQFSSWTQNDQKEFVMALWNTQQQPLTTASTLYQEPLDRASLQPRPTYAVHRKPPSFDFVKADPHTDYYHEVTSCKNRMAERLLALLSHQNHLEPDQVTPASGKLFESLHSKDQLQLLIGIHQSRTVPPAEQNTASTRRPFIGIIKRDMRALAEVGGSKEVGTRVTINGGEYMFLRRPA